MIDSSSCSMCVCVCVSGCECVSACVCECQALPIDKPLECARHCQIADRCSSAAGAGDTVVGVSVGVGWINAYTHTHTHCARARAKLEWHLSFFASGAICRHSLSRPSSKQSHEKSHEL